MNSADASAPYPVHVHGDLHEPLSRWLWLVKWLLAIPHYLVALALTGGAVSFGGGDDNGSGGTVPLLGVLVVIAAVILLFTAKYPPRLFDFIIGINRWLYRVLAYAALMRDEYPPFRLDQGQRDIDKVMP